jgi:hypothetical protein
MAVITDLKILLVYFLSENTRYKSIQIVIFEDETLWL